VYKCAWVGIKEIIICECKVPVRAMKNYFVSRSTTALIPNLGASWMWVVSISTPADLPRANSSGIQWLGDWVGTGGGLDVLNKRKVPCPCRESKHDSLVLHLIMYINFFGEKQVAFCRFLSTCALLLYRYLPNRNPIFISGWG